MRWEWAYLFDQNTNSNYWSLYCRLSRAVCLVKQSFDKSVVLTEHEVQLQEVYRITGWCLLNKGISLSWELEWRFRLKFSAENVWNVCNVRNVWTLSRLASILFLTLSYFRLPYDFRYSNVFSEDLNGREIRARYLSPRTNMLIWLIFIYILAWTEFQLYLQDICYSVIDSDNDCKTQRTRRTFVYHPELLRFLGNSLWSSG